MCLAILSLITTIILKNSSRGKLSFSKLLENMGRLLTAQSCHTLNSLDWSRIFKTQLTRYSMTLLLLIWIQSSSILNKSFNGLLLNTYFGFKTFPIFPTLESITKKKGVRVVAVPEIFNGLSRIYKVHGNVEKTLRNRAKQIWKKPPKKRAKGPTPRGRRNLVNQVMLKGQYFQELIMGRAAIFCNSFDREMFQDFFHDMKNLFVISGKKYFPHFMNFMVNKKHVLAHKFHFM